MYRCFVCDAPAVVACGCDEMKEDKRTVIASGEDADLFLPEPVVDCQMGEMEPELQQGE